MTFLTEFLVFFLVFWWLMLIMYKQSIPVRLYNKFKYKIIDKLTNCDFCMESHTATALAIILALHHQNHLILLYGPMSAALSNILKK
jgi:hypothetical protein